MTPRVRALTATLLAAATLNLAPLGAVAQTVPTPEPTTPEPDDPGPVDIYGAGSEGTAGVGVQGGGIGHGGGASPNGGDEGSCMGVYCSPLIDEFLHLSCVFGFDTLCPDDAEPQMPPAIDVAQLALDSVDFTIPTPHTSPPGRQITGLTTWFWLDPGQWQPTTAHAEIPGLWASVTVTPTTARWTPGDGAAAVTCEGPGRPHPGTDGARTGCGHTYTNHGDYTLTIDVTYTVTWTSSTGAGGTLDPVTLTTSTPIHVEQRQAVTD